ncbi:BA75_02181T0 [Komagataella pastoris]|uniref:BA75_02181T0 n=1 Tax=Komagataella pastoris TaxID=4922 RepID=A0A1B2JCU8_PICPA|nr:BA75_02181T0 [Komagataella pastoris]
MSTSDKKEPIETPGGQELEKATENLTLGDSADLNEAKTSPIEKKQAPVEAEGEELPPQRPPRPVSPLTQAKQTLKEAFPQFEEKYITAVLVASSGDLDPAFNALLYLSDPTFVPEIPKPQHPKLPTRQSQGGEVSQIESDEKLARRLARQYKSSSRSSGSTRRESHRKQDAESDDDFFDKFLDKDLPQFTEQLSKNVEGARSKINSWIGGLGKKIDQTASNQGDQPQSKNLFSAFGNNNPTSRGSSLEKARSDVEQDVENVSSNTGIAFSSQDPTLDFDAPETRAANETKETKNVSTVEKASPEKDRWQPLQSADPHPIDDDTFLVEDSDEEEEAKITKNKV